MASPYALSLSDTAASVLPEKVIRSKLSPALAGIAEVISVDATLKLCRSFGGTRIYIAEKPTRHGAIARAIGFEAACKLGKVYGREDLHIPRGSELRRRIRNEKIQRAHHAGQTIREIALNFDLSMRQVTGILAGR
jgi:Mor family transcriptional regulator